jgi:hypothetical protein
MSSKYTRDLFNNILSMTSQEFESLRMTINSAALHMGTGNAEEAEKKFDQFAAALERMTNKIIEFKENDLFQKQLDQGRKD